MKKIKYIYSFILGLLITCNAFGQVELNETYTNFDDEWTTATVTTIPMDDRELEEEWGAYLEENFEIELNKVESKRDTTLYISKNVVRNNLSDTTYSIYTKIVERQDGNSDLYTFWVYDENRLLNTEEHPDKIEDMEILMYDFASSAFIKYYKQEIKVVEKKQQKLERMLNRLERRNQRLEKRNERYREKAEDYQDKINLNIENKDDNQMEMRALRIQHESLENRMDVLKYNLNLILIANDKG